MKHTLAYKTDFQGLPISIENRAGSYRHWKDPRSGDSGKTKQFYPYGYIKGTLGLDGDEVDVYLGPDKKSEKVFIITQHRLPEFEKVDEQKVMLGFRDALSAKTAYLQHFDDASFFGNMKELTMYDFKKELGKKKGKLIKSHQSLYLSKSMVGSNIPGRPRLYLNPGKV